MLDKIWKNRKNIDEIKRELELTEPRYRTIRKEANHKDLIKRLRSILKSRGPKNKETLVR